MAEKQDYPFQLNFKTQGQTLINLRAMTPDELSNQMRALTDLSGQVSSVEAALAGKAPTHEQAVATVQQHLGGQVIQDQQWVEQGQPPQWAVQPQQQAPQQPQWGQQAPQQQYNQPPQAPPTSCQHGPMIRKTGNGAKGPWGAYFCPVPKGTPGACEPVWDKKGR